MIEVMFSFSALCVCVCARVCPGGDVTGLVRTGQYVSDLFQSGALTCLICIASVKRTQAVSVLLMISCYVNILNIVFQRLLIYLCSLKARDGVFR